MTTTLHLYDNSSPSFTSSGSFGGTQNSGAEFSTTGGGYVVGIRFYRPGSSLAKPTGLSLWDHTTSTLVGHIPTADVRDDGTVGWQESGFASAIPLTNGHNYHVLMYQPGGTPAYQSLIATRSAAPSPLVFGDHALVYKSGAETDTDSFFDSVYYPVDIVWTDDGTLITGTGGPPVGGGGSTATSGDLADWLDTAIGTQLHSAPLQTYTLATGSSGFAAIKGVVDTIAASVGSGLGIVAAALTTNLATANAALVHAATTWSDALAAALQTMSDDFASFGASKPAQGGGDFGSGTFPSNVGTLVWTMLDETDFAGSIAWAQPADVYVLSITARPIGLPLNLTDGVHTIYRCGWWTPLNGSFARQRSYIDFEDSHLAIGAERMPGVLVSLQPGGEGHIQAWALT